METPTCFEPAEFRHVPQWNLHVFEFQVWREREADMRQTFGNHLRSAVFRERQLRPQIAVSGENGAGEVQRLFFQSPPVKSELR